MTTNKLTQRQELFCIHFFQTGHATNSAIAAGYIPSRASQTASRLVTYGKIKEYLQELRQKAVDASIMNYQERQQVLTEIGRGRLADFMTDRTPEKLRSAALQEIKIVKGKSTIIKLHDPVKAIAELNKMDKVYSDGTTVNVDNRKVEITVAYDKPKKPEITDGNDDEV